MTAIMMHAPTLWFGTWVRPSSTDGSRGSARARRVWAPLLRHGLQEGALLAQDEALLTGEAEVRRALRIGLQARAIGLVGCQAVERNEGPGDVVGALVRQKVADQAAPALGDDAPPVAGVLCEGLALEGIDDVTDEDGDGHGCLLVEGRPYHLVCRPHFGCDRSRKDTLTERP